MSASGRSGGATWATPLVGLMLSVWACSSGSSGVSAPTPKPRIDKTVAETMPLYVPPGSYDFSRNPRLLDRIQSGPHGYFRFINAVFAEAVCVRFADSIASMPTVNLHGDAHLEQYAVTSLGRGLTDFDDSSAGPAVLDLVRFGVSLRLASANRGFEDRFDELYGEFIRGYQDALEDPGLEAPMPVMASRIRDGFSADRRGFLDWVESQMQPMDEALRAELLRTLGEYADTMLEEHPQLARTFFRVKSVGELHMGIGSALDEKYLFRVEGLTDANEDDVVLESKEIRNLGGISCIRGARSVDPFRILVGQSRIAYEPYPYLGYATFRGKNFWIHGWADNYKELKLEELSSADELREVVYDIGVQLGRGHPNQIARPHDLQLRRMQRSVLDRHEQDVDRAIEEIAESVVAAWERFRDEAGTVPERPPE